MGFQHQRRIRFQDADPAGIVFFAMMATALPEPLRAALARHLVSG